MWLLIKVAGALGFPIGLFWSVGAAISHKSTILPVTVTLVALFMFVAARFQESSKP